MIRLIHGDCREVLKTLPDCSVHCCITSPPYFGLRSYLPSGHADKHLEIGSELTVEAWVQTMVEVFREVRRVLRDDGTCWVNLGDSYANDGKWGGTTGGKQEYLGEENSKRVGREKRITGLKPKDLIGQPWRLAFALQADGWWLRQEIIWAKKNPMPESIRDRFTKAHEHVFLLSKSERYFFDFDAVQEPVEGGAHARLPGNKAHAAATLYTEGDEKHRTKAGLVAYAERARAAKRKLAEPGEGIKSNTSFVAVSAGELTATRNPRSVRWLASEPFKGAHFATYPPELIRPFILAGCPLGGVVLDPFGGAGTTGLVADQHGRNAILIDLDERNAPMAHDRIASDGPLFANVEVA